MSYWHWGGPVGRRVYIFGPGYRPRNSTGPGAAAPAAPLIVTPLTHTHTHTHTHTGYWWRLGYPCKKWYISSCIYIYIDIYLAVYILKGNQLCNFVCVWERERGNRWIQFEVSVTVSEHVMFWNCWWKKNTHGISIHTVMLFLCLRGLDYCVGPLLLLTVKVYEVSRFMTCHWCQASLFASREPGVQIYKVYNFKKKKKKLNLAWLCYLMQAGYTLGHDPHH